MTKRNGSKMGIAVFLLCAATANAAPTINLSKKIGPPTTEIVVWGHGFHPDSLVDIYFDTKNEALVLTNNEGEFQHTVIHAPPEAHPGEHWVKALERNNDNGDQKRFVVFTSWPQLGFDQGRTNSNEYENVLSPSNVRNLGVHWSHSYNELAWGDSASPIVADGQLLIGSIANNPPFRLYALDAVTGDPLWHISNDSPYYLTPAVAGDTIYIYSGILYALGADGGALLWSYNSCNNACTDTDTSPVAADGVVYANMGDNTLGAVFALNARTGSLLWKWDANSSSSLSPPALADGMLYVGSTDDNVYALDATTGTTVWKYATTNWVFDAPVVADGTVYAASLDSYVYALDARTGALLWKYSFGQYGISSPALSHGVLYADGADNNVYALNARTGALIWKYDTGNATQTLSVANGVVYGGSLWDEVWALDAITGNLLWQYHSGYSEDELVAAPTIANGILYTTSFSGALRAFELTMAKTVPGLY